MPATLVGTVGLFGIAADETGLIIDGLDDESKMKTKWMENRVGERVGCADYDESIEIEMKGKITATSPWSQKLSAVMTLTNTISAGFLNTVLTGKTLVRNVKRTRKSEEWVELSVSAEMLPFFPAS